ncbi:hypothetical protein LTR22_027735 [Elasticomyces elasticus]|nr:hypothetical protein LTR22_027735 [Elasticomyces elasticus]
MSKILAVFGASGNKGSSAIRAVLNDAALSRDFKVRAITRDVNKESVVAWQKEGVEAVAYAGPPTIQCRERWLIIAPDFWETLSAETEITQGNFVADAYKAAGVKHPIFSSLINTTDASKGKLPNIAHFDGKAKIEAYSREIGVPATFTMHSVFMSGYFNLIRGGDAGSYSLALPIDGEEAQIPLLDKTGYIGKFVRAIMQDFPACVGKQVHAAVDYYTPERLMADFSEVVGSPASFVQVPVETLKGFLPPLVAQEILENMLLFEEPGYYAGASLKDSQRGLR